LVDSIRYELPVRFAHMRQVILQASSWDKNQMTLVDADTDWSVGSPINIPF
jgi:hypothetical protein